MNQPGMRVIEQLNINNKPLKDYSHKDVMRICYTLVQDLAKYERAYKLLFTVFAHQSLNFEEVSEQ